MKKIYKQTIVYIDDSFHKKTLSTFFLRDVLSEKFNVVDFWVDNWERGEKLSVSELNNLDCDFVLFFQIIPSLEELRKIRHKIIWVPMYDGVVQLPHVFWQELATISIKIISFSKTLSDLLDLVGINNLNLKYYLDPSKIEAIDDYVMKKMYFWQRTRINFSDVKKIIGTQKIDSLCLKVDTDPKYKAFIPTKSDIDKYGIRIVEHSKTKAEHLALLTSCNIFVAPREYEGIGMSFIEAMTAGMAVVAKDQPTMNEYINHGENGYLFSDSHEIDLTNFKEIGTNARKSCVVGYKRWIESIPTIFDFIYSPYIVPKRKSFNLYLAKGIFFVRRHIFGQLNNFKIYIISVTSRT